MTKLTVAVLLLALTGAVAFADDAPDPAAQQAASDDSMLGMLTMKPGAEASEADCGYMKSMQAMEQTLMKTEMSGDASGEFVRIMIPHHQSAVDMVDILLQQKDLDPQVRAMAEKMRADQM